MQTRKPVTGLATILAVAVTIGGCGTADAPSQAATVSTPVETTEPGVLTSPELLREFARTWDDADWDGMASIASRDVIDVAKEWHAEGGDAQTGVNYVVDTCAADGATSGQCEFVYAPPDGFGLLFDVSYGSTDAGLIVTDLTFGGDVG